MPRPDNSRPSALPTAMAIDFTGVESRKGGGGIRVQAGDYLLEVATVEVRENNAKNGKYVLWGLRPIKGPEVRVGTIRHMTSLKPEQLWSLKGFLEDLLAKGIDQKAVKINFSNYVGKQIGATVEDDDPYTNPTTGKTSIKSKVAYTYPASEYKDAAVTAVDSDDEDDETQDVDATESDDEDDEELETIDDDEI